MRWKVVQAWAGIWLAASLGLAAGHAVAQNDQTPSDQTQSDQAPAGPAHDPALRDIDHFTGGDPQHGNQLFQRYCRGCHGPDGRGEGMTFQPHINNLTRKDYIEFIPDGFLYTVITEGGAAVGKSGFMPSWKSTLSDQDIKDVIAFIRTLPTY
jgi:mono/diheme cytochrome c family protein